MASVGTPLVDPNATEAAGWGGIGANKGRMDLPLYDKCAPLPRADMELGANGHPVGSNDNVKNLGFLQAAPFDVEAGDTSTGVNRW